MRGFNLLVILALVGSQVCAKSSDSDWLKQLQNTNIPNYVDTEDTGAVVLWDTLNCTISNDGTVTNEILRAYKFFSSKAFESAVAKCAYFSDTDKVVELKAWTISPEGKVKKYKKKDFIDTIDSEFRQLATTARMAKLYASGDQETGSIFAFKTITRERNVFLGMRWYFDSSYDCLYSRISLDIPPSWRVQATPFNSDDIPAEISGNTYTWEMRNLKALKDEGLCPSFPVVAKWILIRIIPDDFNNPWIEESWEGISKSRTPDYFATTHPEKIVRNQADKLKGKNRLATIENVCRYAQDINYISINLNLGKGNGYIPRSTSEVIDTGYGDCKDKASTICTLLNLNGIEAYPLIVKSPETSRPELIFENAPTSTQFNHAIVAIPVDGIESKLLATITHDALGKLLIFDPTDEHTSIGDLPIYLQGSKGLLLAGEKGGLVQLPQIPPEANISKRKISIEIFESGKAHCKIDEASIGQAAASGSRLEYFRDSQFEKGLQAFFRKSHPMIEAFTFTREDLSDQGRFNLNVEFDSPMFTKLMGRGMLLVFKPVSMDRYEYYPFEEESRTLPIQLTYSNLEEVTDFKLPTGYSVSDIPEAVEIKHDFGSYTLKFSHMEATQSIRMTRKCQTNSKIIPAERFDEVAEFFKTRIRAEKASIVLERI